MHLIQIDHPWNLCWLDCAISCFRLLAAEGRHAKRRKDAIRKDTTRKDDKIKVSNGVLSYGVFSSFRSEISSFRAESFVFSSFRMESYRLFVFRMASFLSAWRLFAKRRKDEMAQSSHHQNPSTTIFLDLISCINFLVYHREK